MGMYKKDDLIQIDYAEFGKTMDILTKKIADYQMAHNIKFDLVVPLLRSGAFPAFHIAARLEIKEILPMYYMYEHGQIVKRLETPKLTRSIKSNPNILICDSCLSSGTTYKTVINELKTLYPNAIFYAAIVWLEEGIKTLPETEHIFYGKRTCEKKTSQNPETINGITMAPWEDLEVDWNEIKDY